MLTGKIGEKSYMLGIDATNVERLKEGHPIRKSLRFLGVDITIVIAYGDSLDDIVKGMEKAGFKVTVTDQESLLKQKERS